MENANNKVTIYGKIMTPPIFEHEIYGEAFYSMNVAIDRTSGFTDTLPVTISERLLNTYGFACGSMLKALGQFRSYNKHTDGKSRLMLTVFVTEVLDETTMLTSTNEIILTGYVCKPPVYRTTPFGREIGDLLLAVNRSYGKSDYLPCIVWGRNARYIEQLAVGTKLTVYGRIQSREYQKRQPDDSLSTLTAYEVSILRITEYDGQK